MLHELNEKNFEENISKGIKLVEFFAVWCHFCQKQMPVLEEMAKENIWIGTVDIDKNPELTKAYGINSFPSFVLFKEGNILTKFQGLHSKYELVNILKDYS